MLAVLLALIAPVLAQAGPTASAAAATVTGTVTSKEKIALSPDAVTVVTLVDQQVGQAAGTIIGQQAITGGQFPIAFAVPYDSAAIDSTHSYALFASVIDAGTRRQTVEAVPVITGGPTANVALPVVTISTAASVSGTITKADKTALTGAAVGYAILVNTNTGTLVARQVIPAPGTTPIAFQITYDPGIIDPAATYVVRAAIVDAGKTWEGRTGVPAVTNGAPSEGLAVPVTLVGTPQPTAAPTVKPTDGTDGGTDGQADRGSDGQADGGTDRAAHGCADGRADGRTDGGSDGGSHGGSHGCADGRPDCGSHRFAHGRTDGRADRRADGEPQRDRVPDRVSRRPRRPPAPSRAP